MSFKRILLVLLLLVLCAGLGWYFWPQKVGIKRQISFTEFVREVQNDKVGSVKITGSQVVGTFNNSKDTLETAIPTNFPDIHKLLQDKGVNVEMKDPSSFSWGTFFSIAGLLVIGGIALFTALAFSADHARKGNQETGKSTPYSPQDQATKTTFVDVQGADEAKTALSQIVMFLKNPKKFQEIGARVPKGVLLSGPPGTGKTLLARAVAGEAKVRFFSHSAPEFVELFVGRGASRVRDLFEKARKEKPCIIFIDEIDAIARRRSSGHDLSGGQDEREQTLNQLLIEMDGFQQHNSSIIIIAATNRDDVLDPALLRRFDRQVTLPMPDLFGREKIFEVHLKKVLHEQDISFKKLAQLTPDFTGADIENLVNEAAIRAASDDRSKVIMADLLTCLSRIIPDDERLLSISNSWEKSVAGQDRAKQELAVAAMMHYGYARRARDGAHGVRMKSGILLIGPHGVGKTYLARSLAEHLKVPFVTVETTHLIASSLNPNPLAFLLHGLLKEAGGDVRRAEYGIICVQSLDKVVNHEFHQGNEIQSLLSALLRGTTIDVPTTRGVVNAQSRQINTRNIMVVLEGTFPEIEEEIRYRRKVSDFSSSWEPLDEAVWSLINKGFSAELVEALSAITVFDSLSESEIESILRKRQGSLLLDACEEVLNIQANGRDEKLALSPYLARIATLLKAKRIGAKGIATVLNDICQFSLMHPPGTDPTPLDGFFAKQLKAQPDDALFTREDVPSPDGKLIIPSDHGYIASQRTGGTDYCLIVIEYRLGQLLPELDNVPLLDWLIGQRGALFLGESIALQCRRPENSTTVYPTASYSARTFTLFKELDLIPERLQESLSNWRKEIEQLAERVSYPDGVIAVEGIVADRSAGEIDDHRALILLWGVAQRCGVEVVVEANSALDHLFQARRLLDDVHAGSLRSEFTGVSDDRAKQFNRLIGNLTYVKDLLDVPDEEMLLRASRSSAGVSAIVSMVNAISSPQKLQDSVISLVNLIISIAQDHLPKQDSRAMLDAEEVKCFWSQEVVRLRKMADPATRANLAKLVEGVDHCVQALVAGAELEVLRFVHEIESSLCTDRQAVILFKWATQLNAFEGMLSRQASKQDLFRWQIGFHFNTEQMLNALRKGFPNDKLWEIEEDQYNLVIDAVNKIEEYYSALAKGAVQAVENGMKHLTEQQSKLGILIASEFESGIIQTYCREHDYRLSIIIPRLTNQQLSQA